MNFLQHRLVWLAAIIITLGVLLFIPTTYRKEIRPGTDSYSTHRQLTGSKVVTAELIAPANFTGAGFILVNMKKVPGGPVEVRYFDSNRQPIEQATIEVGAIKDDTFAWAYIPATTKTNGPINVEIQAPHATAQNPVGVRFDRKTGDVALAISEQVPAWRQVPLWARDNKDLARHIGRLVAIWSVTAIVLLGLERFVKKENMRLLIGVAVVAGVALAIRWPLLSSVESVFGGDAFNYFFKALAWVNGYDPLFADARKGPIYALALIPGLLMPDPLLWGRVLNIVSATIGSVLIVYIFALLAAPVPIAIAAGLLVAVNRQLWWESVHSLGNIPFTALLITSLYFYIKALQKRGAYGLGLTSALVALTRYEGILVGAILMPALWLQKKFKLQTLRQLLVPFVILMSVPLVMWAVTGQLGIRTWSDIESDGGLGLAHSIDDFKENFKLYRLVIGRAWVFAPYVGKQLTACIWGIVAAGVFAAVRRWRPGILPVLQSVGASILTIVLIGIIFRDSGDVLKQLSLVVTFVTGMGVGFGLLHFPRTAIPVILIFISQSLVITAILPKDRYYIHILPLLALAVASGVWTLYSTGKAWQRNVLPVLLISFLVSIVYVDSQHSLGGLVEEYNQQSQETTVILKAAKNLRSQPGLVAVGSDYLPLRLYLGDERFKNLHDKKTPAQLIAWLEETQAKHILEVSSNPVFEQVVNQYANRFTQTAFFTTKFGSTTTTIYEFK